MTDTERALLLLLAKAVARLDSKNPPGDHDAIRSLIRDVEKDPKDDPLTAVVLQVLADVPHAKGPFVMRCGQRVTAQTAERIKGAWTAAFRAADRPVPPLLLIDPDFTLEAPGAFSTETASDEAAG